MRVPEEGDTVSARAQPLESGGSVLAAVPTPQLDLARVNAA